jgi:hypothetical protein
MAARFPSAGKQLSDKKKAGNRQIAGLFSIAGIVGRAASGQ